MPQEGYSGDINADFKQQLVRMRTSAAPAPPPAPSSFKDEFTKKLNNVRSSQPATGKDRSFSPPPGQTDNTAIYLSHAKPGPYKTELNGKEESQFRQWVSENSVPFEDSDRADYDMRGYWKALIGGDKRARQAENKHFPDIWKTPYHKSFSNESMYALPTAPKWSGNKLVGENGKILVDESKPEVPQEASQDSPQAYIDKYAPVYGVDPRLIQAMMGRESGGKQSAVSPKGALGLMQLMPETARQLGVDPTDPEDNIKGGVKYMADLLAHFGGDTRLALAAYHAGQGAVDKAKGIPNTTDGMTRTADYVDQIMGRYDRIRTSSTSPLAMSPTPEEKPVAEKPKQKPKFASEAGTYRYTTMGGATINRTYDRSEFKNELDTLRSDGQEKYIQDKNLKFEPEPGMYPAQDADEVDPIKHPFRFIGFLNQIWSDIGSDIDETLFDENKRNEAFRNHMLQQIQNPGTPEQERKEYQIGLREFDLSVSDQQKKIGATEQASVPVARSLVHDLFDWYNPMMMGLRAFHGVGGAASELTGKSGVMARRAFYTANAAIGSKFTYDQTQSAMDKFRQGDSAGGWSDLGGASAMAFMTAIGLAYARPKAHPVEIQEETLRRLDKLHATLRDQPEFRRLADLVKEGKVRPLNLPNMNPEQISAVIEDLRKRAGGRRGADMRGPVEGEQQPSSLPFNVTDRRGTEKEESGQPHIIDAPILSAEEREYRRQDEREKETMELLAQERNERERRSLANAQRYKDEVEQQLAKERELERRDKRRVAPAQLVDLRGRMENLAQENMYVDAADMARSLLEKKPRGKALTASEKDFLRLWEERKRMTRGVSGAEDARLTKFGMEQAQQEGELVEREQKLIDASRKLNEKARKASTPEETEDLAAQSEEASRQAEQIRTEVDQARAAREAAKQGQQEFPLGAPVSKVDGAATQVRLPDGRKLAAHYAVTTVDQLIASHHPESFEWNDKYKPQKMQPRDYKKNKDARAGVIAGGGEFEYDSFHNTDNTGHNGPPIVLSDGRIAGGNGRAMRFMRALKTEQREAIHADLVKKAVQFGINPENIPPAEKMPVLVRVLDDSPIDLQSLIELGQDLNRDEMRGFSTAEQAVMSGDRLSQDTLEWVSRRLDDMGEDASIRELMRHQALALFQKLVADGVISPTKRAEFVTNDGELTNRAKDMFENAMLGKVITDPDLIATMPKHIKDKLFRSLAPLSKIRASDPAWDFTDYLQEAVRHWKRIDSISDTLDVYGKDLPRSEQYMRFQNGKMIKEEIHPAVEALVRLLDEKSQKIKEAFYKYIDDYEGRQQSLMGIEPPTPRASFNKDIAEKVGVEVSEGEWGTLRPVEKPAEKPKVEAAQKGVTAEDDFGELADVPTDQLEADIEQLRQIVPDESDPMLKGYLRELAKRKDRSQEVKAAEAPKESEESQAAEAAFNTAKADVDLAKALSTSGPLTEEKLRDILSQHPNYSAGKVGAVVTVMKAFAEKYLGMPFDRWLETKIAKVNIGGAGPAKIGEPVEGEKTLFQGKNRKMDPLPGFEHTFEERKEARAEYEGEQLSLEILEKKGDISKKAGEMERHSPLFSGSGASGERSLFDPAPDGQEKTLEPTPEDKPRDTLFQSGHGPSMASEEELGRGEKFWRVKKNGQLTYQGVSPDAQLQDGEALIATKADGSMRVQEQRMSMSDASALDRVRPKIQQALTGLMRRDPMYQGNKGAVDFMEDGRAVIHLLENADISTVMHEFAHVARRNLKPEDMGIVKDWLKIKDNAAWDVVSEEKFARAFEKYLYDGEAPVPALKAVFKRIRDWMVEVYKAVKGSPINVRFPDEVRQVFDRMVAGEDARPKTLDAPPVEQGKKGDAVELLREAIKNLPRGVKMPGMAGGGVVDFGKENPTQKDLQHYLQLLIEKHVDEQELPFPKDVADRILRSVGEQKIESVRSARWSDREYEDIRNAGSFDDDEKMRDIAHKVASYVDEKKYRKLGWEDFMPYRVARLKPEAADRGKLSNAIQNEARRIQAVQEAKGDLVTPEERISATKIAEGGEALSDSMSEARMRIFPDQEQAIQWARTNQDKIRGVQLFTLQDGRGFAHFLPRDPKVLFQEVDPTEIDRRIRLIDERMGKIIPEAERSRLGKMRQELLAQKTQRGLAFSPPPDNALKVIKLWTPEGEREITDGARQTDPERRTSDAAAELQEPRRSKSVSEPAGRSGSAEQDRSAGRGLRGSDKGGRAKRDGGEPRKALRDVEPAKLDAPVHERGTELYTKEQWQERAKLLRLPENSPAPTVRIPSSLRRMLIFPGQAEVVESALSGLKQHDAYIIATTTGTGKTYTGSAILNQLHKSNMRTLILTTSKDLIHQKGNGWIAVARDFDADVNELPPGVSFPDEPGAYITTYATAIGRQGIEDGNWDLVISDEIGEARKWYSSQRGAMMKTLASNAKKVLYMSATPFHTALELGHMEKLGLWREQGFSAWGKQFGIYKDAEGNWAGGNAPKKLMKLREQLIERGQFTNVDRNMEGFETSFAQVPLTPEQVRDVKNISEAFKLAEDYFKRIGKKSMIRAVKGNAVTYVKKYLERARLPQAIELMKKLDKEGWKTILFSETKAERHEIFDFLQPVDEALGGRLSEMLPPLPDVPEELEKEFGEDLANYSGPHSAFRSSEKEAFNEDSKKHIYVSYAAGGIGVSLHDTVGNKPRAVIYLGPPYSGVMFDQAIGRPWRYGTKSNVHAIFMTSNARPEIHLILEKVAPRMSSLRALVSGVDEQDKFVNTLRNMDSVREGQLAYELGNKVKVDADDFLDTETTHAVQSWKDVKIQSAETAKNKGMKFPEEPAGGPGVIKLFQQDEHEEAEPPEDFDLPKQHSARMDNDIQRHQFENGGPLPAPNRTVIADDISSQALAEMRDEANGDPTETVILRWDNAKKYIVGVWDSVEGSRPVKAAKVQDMYWLTNGRKVIRDVAAEAGAPEVGIKIARMLPEYHVEWGNISGPWVHEYFDILKANDISTKRKVKVRDPKTGEEKEVNEHHNLVMAKQGKQIPANPRIARAVEQTTKLLNDVRSRLAKENVAVEIFDQGSGQKRMVPFAEIMDDPNYWPRKYDPNYEIRTTDPETGQVEVTKLKDLLGGELGDAKRERIMKYMMKEHGMSLAQAEDFMEGRGRDVPLVGNVERAREYDLPFYRTDPAAMISYLEGAGEAAARTRVFGQQRQKLENEITRIPSVKARSRVREIMDSVLSKRPFEEETKALVSLAADWSVLSKMTFSALKAVGHSVHAAMSSNTRAYLRGVVEGTTGWKQAHDHAVLSGAILEQYKTEMLREYGAKRKIASKFLDVVGFQGTYEFGRVVSDATARQYLTRYALPKLMKERSVEYYRRTLKDVYLLSDDAIDSAIDRGGWTEEDLNRAGKALSDKTMFTFDPSELPPAWRARSKEPIADNVLAGVRVMTLLKGYMFKTSALLRERIIDEVKQGNFRPLIPFLVLYPVMGELIADLGALFTANRKRYDDLMNDKESWESKLMFRFIGDMAHATGLTLIDTLLEATFRQHKPMYAARDVYEFAIGPFLADGVHTFLQLPMELLSAQTKKRGSTANEKRWNSLVRWSRATFSAVTPVVNLTKGDDKHKKKPHADYHFTSMPTQ